MNMFRTTLFTLCLSVVLIACSSKPPSIGAVNDQSDESRILKIKGIDKDQAVNIATDAARKSNKSLATYKIVPCELVRTWLIIFDGGGPEYVIDKSSGKILRTQVIPQGGNAGVDTNVEPNHTGIDKNQAIQIAKRAARQEYGAKGLDIDQFVILPCELPKAWRIVFDYRLDPGQDVSTLPNAGFPKYVIDKQTGEILFKEVN